MLHLVEIFLKHIAISLSNLFHWNHIQSHDIELGINAPTFKTLHEQYIVNRTASTQQWVYSKYGGDGGLYTPPHILRQAAWTITKSNLVCAESTWSLRPFWLAVHASLSIFCSNMDCTWTSPSTDSVQSPQTVLVSLCRFRHPHKNYTEQGLNQSFNHGPNSDC